MILVTGATGRIGKHLVAALLQEGENVRVLARDPKKATDLWENSVHVVQGDILDKAVLAEAMKDVDIVYHFAALVGYSFPREKLFQVNVEGTRNVMEAAKGKRIIHLSSASVYGKKITSTITEQTLFAPTDVYGESKAAADNLAREAGAIVLRPTVVYGPGFTTGFSTLLNMIAKKRLFIPGSGKNRLQWTHINDLVSALLLTRKKGRPGEAYNIVSDDVLTQEELYDLLAQMLDVPAPKWYMNATLIRIFSKIKGKRFSAYVETMMADRTFDCSKAKKELGWQPKVAFKVGMKEVVMEHLLRKVTRK